MLGKITKTVVDRLPLGSLLWDTSLVGFGVRRQRKSAFYLVRYRIGERQRFLTIGRHGSPWTPNTARREAQRLLGVVASGVDPFIARAEARERFVETFGAEIDRYLDRRRSVMKPRALEEVSRHLLRHAKPLHPLPLAEIDRRTIASRLGEIETASGPVARNRVRSSLSAFFNWSIREGLIELNPVTGTGKADEGHSRDRTLSETELARIWQGLGKDQFSDIVRLLILTGQRREEIGGLRWSEVDLKRKLIVLPPERTKNKRQHELPLSKQALSIIEDRRALRFIQKQREQGEWVWGRRWTNWSDHKAQLDLKLNGEVKEWRLHDLRRSAATMMAELGVLPHIIEAILNHVSGHRAGVAGIYNRARYQDGMCSGLQLWADYIDGLRPTD
jgi:integrase